MSITFWPPVGILIATLLLNRKSGWPWWVLAGGLAELTCNAVWFHNPLPFALIYYAGNALEGLTAAWLITRYSNRPFRLESLEEVAAFVVLAAGAAPMVSATVIGVTDALQGKHSFTTAWPLVWLGDSTGLLVSTPLTLAVVLAWRERARIPPRQLLEAAVLGLLLLSVGSLALKGYLPTVYLTMPVLLWAAARFQMRGAAVALGLITFTTAAFTLTGAGELAGGLELLHEKAVMLQAFLGISAASALVVGALSQLHQQALRDLKAVNARLEARVAERTAELRDSEGRLREADRRKDEFLATLAHELRNPLAPVRNAVQVLKLQDLATPELQWSRDIIDRQIQTMARLIDDLMDVTRINQGKIQLRPERIELAKVIQWAVEMNRPLMEQMSHTLTVTLPDQPVFLEADPTRLSQVFLNLLNNAAKYTEPGGRIDLQAELQEETLVVSIRDSGIGIPTAELPAIFEMFSQVEGALTRSQGGLGIGLSLVRSLVEMHGGSVEARSAGPGQGSEFVIRLAASADLDRPHETPSTEPDGEPARGLHILVIDDLRDTADSLATLLQMLGNTVHTCYDGETAVEAAAKLRPHIVLCDIGLPKLNGYEVCRAIRQHPWGQDMVLVAITGWGQEGDRRAAQDAGFDHHLVKPVDLPALMKLLAGIDGGGR